MNFTLNKNLLDHFIYSSDKQVLKNFLKKQGVSIPKDEDIQSLLSFLLFFKANSRLDFENQKNRIISGLSELFNFNSSVLKFRMKFLTHDFIDGKEFKAFRRDFTTTVLDRLYANEHNIKDGVRSRINEQYVNQSSICGAIQNLVVLKEKNISIDI